EGGLAAGDGTPAVLEVPEIINRYYTVQVMDEWGDVIANINPRTFPSHPHGTFVFVKPDTRVTGAAGCCPHRAPLEQSQGPRSDRGQAGSRRRRQASAEAGRVVAQQSI